MVSSFNSNTIGNSHKITGNGIFFWCISMKFTMLILCTTKTKKEKKVSQNSFTSHLALLLASDAYRFLFANQIILLRCKLFLVFQWGQSTFSPLHRSLFMPNGQLWFLLNCFIWCVRQNVCIGIKQNLILVCASLTESLREYSKRE